MMMKGAKCPLPPQKPNLAGNKSFYSKSLIIASPLNFRQESCPGNIFLRNGILAEKVCNVLYCSKS